MVSPRVSQILRQPYARIIMPDDQGGYAAQLLEFPGCFADGESAQETYNNLEEVAESWLESALAQGMGIPPPFATQGYSGTISLRLPKSLHRRAAQFAHRDGVSLNQFLVSAIAGRVGAEDLVGTMASKLDDRLDRLASRRFFFLGVGEELAGTLGSQLDPSRFADLSEIHQSAATLGQPYAQRLPARREE